MNTSIIAPGQADVKNIKSFNRRDEWWLEVNFNSGAKCVTPATQDEITQVESDLRDRGWQVDASVFHRGFNAKPVEVEEFTFAMPELWPDDYAIEQAWL